MRAVPIREVSHIRSLVVVFILAECLVVLYQTLDTNVVFYANGFLSKWRLKDEDAPLSLQDRIVQQGHPVHVVYVDDNILNHTLIAKELLMLNASGDRCHPPGNSTQNLCPCIPPDLSEYSIVFLSILVSIVLYSSLS